MVTRSGHVEMEGLTVPASRWRHCVDGASSPAWACCVYRTERHAKGSPNRSKKPNSPSRVRLAGVPSKCVSRTPFLPLVFLFWVKGRRLIMPPPNPWDGSSINPHDDARCDRGAPLFFSEVLSIWELKTPPPQKTDLQKKKKPHPG